jgi:hypothetical protein
LITGLSISFNYLECFCLIFVFFACSIRDFVNTDFMNQMNSSVLMSKKQPAVRKHPSSTKAVYLWSADLAAARNVSSKEKVGFEMVLGWFEDWRVAQRLEPGREAARAFWKAQVLSKPRAEWQLEQWKGAFGW